MRISLLTVVAFGLSAIAAQPAAAQDNQDNQDKSTSFRAWSLVKPLAEQPMRRSYHR
jgi:hypothetical protein